MFMKYEKSLKEILNHYYHTSQRTIPLAMLDVPRYQADYLAAKGLLVIVPYVFEEENCRITISDKGLTYFDDKHDKWFRFWVPTIISIIALIGAYRQELAWLLQEVEKLLK